MSPQPPFRLVLSNYFRSQAAALPEEIHRQLKTRLVYLMSNPRHPSLHTHEVKGAIGQFGGKIFEAYVTDKYRMTWEYGPSKGEIILRNIDNHDACLRHP